VGDEGDGYTDLFVMTSSAFNTCSMHEAQSVMASGHQRIESVERVEMKSINTILRDYCKTTPDFLSIDVEGMDSEIIESIDFSKYRPKVLCVETIRICTDGQKRKVTEI